MTNAVVVRAGDENSDCSTASWGIKDFEHLLNAGFFLDLEMDHRALIHYIVTKL